MASSFIGRGWAFPIQPAAAGGVRMVDGEAVIRRSLLLILSTAPGERLMRPDFGCGVHELVFQPNTAALRGAVRDKVGDAVRKWEPRVDLLDVAVDTADGQPTRLLIRLDCRVRSNNAFFNLVYPFYLTEGKR
jgi:phage baseplate assembly protein W